MSSLFRPESECAALRDLDVDSEIHEIMIAFERIYYDTGFPTAPLFYLIACTCCV